MMESEPRTIAYRVQPLASLARILLALSFAIFLSVRAGEPRTPEEKKKELLSRVGDPENAEALQALAAREAIAMGLDDATAAVLFDKITHKTSVALAKGLIVEMGNSSYPALGTKLVERWLRLPLPSKQAAFPIFFRRPVWTDALLDGLYNGLIECAELSPSEIQFLLFHPDAKIAARAKTYLEGRKLLPELHREKVLERFVPAIDGTPDIRAGARVFDLHCARCHRFNETGQAFGPSLNASFQREKLDLLAAILDPHKSIPAPYKPIAVFCKDGRLFTGLVLAETEQFIELAPGAGRTQVVRAEETERIQPLAHSLMPLGFEKLDAQAFTDLLAYLTERPRIFTLPLQSSATASTATRLFSGDDDSEKLVFGRWGPHVVEGVAFEVLDAEGGKRKNAIVLHSPKGRASAAHPRSVRVPCKSDAVELHFLAGVAGFGFPLTPAGTASVTVRLHYADGKTEDHVWKNGEHLCDVSAKEDVPGSKRAIDLRGRHVRYLSIKPQRPKELIDAIEFVKGEDATAPVVFAITVERAP